MHTLLLARRRQVASCGVLASSLCVHFCWHVGARLLLVAFLPAACAYTLVAMLPRLGGRTGASASPGSIAMLPCAFAWRGL